MAAAGELDDGEAVGDLAVLVRVVFLVALVLRAAVVGAVVVVVAMHGLPVYPG